MRADPFCHKQRLKMAAALLSGNTVYLAFQAGSAM
jgi:hypothetical protein